MKTVNHLSIKAMMELAVTRLNGTEVLFYKTIYTK